MLKKRDVVGFKIKSEKVYKYQKFIIADKNLLRDNCFTDPSYPPAGNLKNSSTQA